MPKTAKTQKACSPGSEEVVPRTKAIMSVSEVTMIEAPACARALAIRSGTGISAPLLVRVRVRVRVRVGLGFGLGLGLGLGFRV